MAVRAWRQARMPASMGPSKATPPRSPWTRRIRSSTSSRRRAPSVPLAQVAKKRMGSDARPRSAIREPILRRRPALGAGAVGADADGALGGALRRVHELVGAGHELVGRLGRGEED